jgi:hypothetical protein
MRRGIEIAAPPVRAKHQQKVGKRFVVRRDHPALDRRHLVAEVKGKTCHVSKRADIAGTEFRSECRARILEEHKSIPLLEL